MTAQRVIDKVSSWYKTQGFYEQLVTFSFETIKPYLKGTSVLEIGPADGPMTRLLAPLFKNVTLVEPSHKYAELLHKKFPKANIAKTRIEHFSPPKTYDTIIFSHVLEHITRPIHALSHLTKAMHKGSHLIVIVPNANSLHRHLGVSMGLLPKLTALNAYDNKLGHKRVYTRAELRNHIKRAGLKIVSEGGIMLKLLSNPQMESWDKKIIRGLFVTGKKFPDLCAELYCVCTFL